MITDINSEDRLVQRTFTEHLEKMLGEERLEGTFLNLFTFALSPEAGVKETLLGHCKGG